MRLPDSAADSVADLLDVLDLTCLGEARIVVEGAPGDDETDLGESTPIVFVGRSQKQAHGRVFGGQVLAQSLVAAARTVEPVDGVARPIHSLHAYFVRGGDDSHPIRFVVEKVRDGASFSTRRVQAVQYGQTILSMGCSFQEPARAWTTRTRCRPRLTLTTSPRWPRPWVSTSTRRWRSSSPLADPSSCGTSRATSMSSPGGNRAARQSVWLKARAELPDDPVIHAAVLAYASDYPMLEPVLRRHGVALAGPTAAPGQPRPRDVVPPRGARPTTGCSTRCPARRPLVVGVWESGGCSAPTGHSWHRWPRKACSVSRRGEQPRA
jgi:acyl-CoA thioesterase-2